MKLDKYMVGRRYGKALFEAASDQGLLPDVYQELRGLRKIFLNVDDLGNILTDARLEPNEKDVIFNVLIPHYDGLVGSFLQLVYDYRRMDDLVFMIDEYEHRYDEYRGVLYGTATTVQPLTPEQKAKLETNFAQVVGVKEVRLDNKIDPTVLGGVVVEASHQVIDGSLKNQYEKLRQALLQ